LQAGKNAGTQTSRQAADWALGRKAGRQTGRWMYGRAGWALPGQEGSKACRLGTE